MKVYVSADIEGVTGVTAWDEAEKPKADSAAYREQMTREVVAACQGFLEAGAAELWVKDAHETGRNLEIRKLPREARILKGWSGHPFSMVELLDESFHAAAMIGYHSRAGSAENPLAHTMSGYLTHLRINDRLVSEFLLFGYASSLVGVPVVLVAGDEGLCREVAEVNPAIRTVSVKRGVGSATVSIHPDLAVERIQQAAAESLAGDPSACHIPLPERFEVELGFRKPPLAVKAGYYPGAERTGPSTVVYRTDDYFEVLRFLLFTI